MVMREAIGNYQGQVIACCNDSQGPPELLISVNEDLIYSTVTFKCTVCQLSAKYDLVYVMNTGLHVCSQANKC